MASDTVAVPAAAPVSAAARRPLAGALTRMLGPALVICGYLAGALVVAKHLWADPAGLVVNGNPWDADLFAWFMRYSATALAHGHLPALVTTALNAPQGISVQWNTSVLAAGIALAPVTWLAGPQVSLTVLLTAGFAGSAASLLLVLRGWRFRLVPAAVAGAVYGFSPALVQSAVGHYNLQFAVLPPLLIDAGLRLFITPAGPGRVRSASNKQAVFAGLRLALLAAVQLFICEELLALSAVAGLLLAAFLVAVRPVALFHAVCEALAGRAGVRRAARRLGGPAAGLGVAVACFALVAGAGLVTQFAGPLVQHGNPFLQDYYKNDLSIFLRPSQFQAWHTPASAYLTAWLPGGPAEQLGYLGWPLIAVLVGGSIWLRRNPLVRAILPVIVVLEMFSLGAHPEYGGTVLTSVTMPWHWLADLPVIGLVIPDRFSILADGLAAVMIALVLDHLLGRIPARDPVLAGPAEAGLPPAGFSPAGLPPAGLPPAGLAGHPPSAASRTRLAGVAIGLAVVALAVITLEPVSLPVAPAPAVPAGWSSAITALHLPAGARVLVVPVPENGLTSAMRWQATTGSDISLIGGYFLGPLPDGQAWIDGAGLRPTASYLNALWLASPAGQPYAWAVPNAKPPAPPAATVVADLAYWQAAAVVAVTSPDTGLGRYLNALLGPPTVIRGTVLAWRQASDFQVKLPTSRINPAIGRRRSRSAELRWHPMPSPEVVLALRIIIGLGLTAIALALAGRRLWFLYRLGRTGQPAPERIAALRERPARGASAELTEVIGQRKLFQWSVPGAAHAVTFWGFLVLGLTIIEAYGALFSRTFAIPVIGHWAVLGFAEDLFAVLVLAGLVTFAAIRFRSDPAKKGRDSRFSGSHTGAAWVVLGMIFLVVATLLIYRGAQINTGVFPYPHGAFASELIGGWLAPLGTSANSALETSFILAQLAVVLAFLVIVVNSKHLHIILAPFNVLFSRRPDGLRGLEPMRSNGKVLDFEEADPDTDIFGVGKIEDLSWKALLDLGTCTECGRCQSQCPAWATGKPLSPKMLILDLRDHALAKAPYLLATSDEARAALPDAVKAELERPLVGAAATNPVIDLEVLWACTNCGACVNECPVDIEHIDHIASMRRNQVLIESEFPTEAAVMLKNLENKGDPWGMGEAKRLDWTEGLDFEVPVVDGKIGADVEWLFWVGCAGALEDRAKKTTRAVAELLHTAGVNFAVLGGGESCTGDPARRMGNEFVFAMLAQQNIETLNEAGVRKIIASCPHCFNTLANEYPQLGGTYEVMHHTQVLAKLVADGKLTPVHPIEEKITYHDPCFLGRHNKVYTPPREIMEQVPGVQAQEMHRCKGRGFCCGAGGSRMWMEERIGKRINEERIDEALGTDPDTISTGCPFCLVMLGDAVSAKKSSGEAKESLEVVDVAQLLVRSVGRPGPEQG